MALLLGLLATIVSALIIVLLAVYFARNANRFCARAKTLEEQAHLRANLWKAARDILRETEKHRRK